MLNLVMAFAIQCSAASSVPKRKPADGPVRRMHHNCAAMRHARSLCDQEKPRPPVPEMSVALAAGGLPGFGPDPCCRGSILYPSALLADELGGHAFVSTLTEHNQNVLQWRKRTTE